MDFFCFSLFCVSVLLFSPLHAVPSQNGTQVGLPVLSVRLFINDILFNFINLSFTHYIDFKVIMDPLSLWRGQYNTLDTFGDVIQSFNCPLSDVAVI